MCYIHIMNLRSLDLNLLVVFSALMRKRNVTHAAQTIGLSQPAFSNALTRLRDRLGDELFIRTPDGMRPTAWALELSGPISRALSEIESALDGAHFDALTSKRIFTIASLDYATIVLFPEFLKRIKVEAPGVVIRILAPSVHAGEFLDTQEVDLALLVWPQPPERFVSEELIGEDWVCVFRPGHPLADKKMTLTTYANAEHLMVSTNIKPRDWVDDVLAERGRSRHVGFTMPTYGPAPLVIEATDLVLTCPRRVGTVFSERTGMIMKPCPVAAPFDKKCIDMVWHARLGNNPAQLWLRQMLREVAISTRGSVAGQAVDNP